jgi:two-component system chemotaxis sensor kinase CheA
MFNQLSQNTMPTAANPALLGALQQALDPSAPTVKGNATSKIAVATPASQSSDLNWDDLYAAVAGPAPQSAPVAAAAPVDEEHRASPGRRATDQPDADGMRTGRREHDKVAVAAPESTIRIDTHRLDQVLNLSGEIGLAKNRSTACAPICYKGKTDPETMRALDQAVSHLDLLVSDLQNAVMKTRMQPVGRLFNKYPRVGARSRATAG